MSTNILRPSSICRTFVRLNVIRFSCLGVIVFAFCTKTIAHCLNDANEFSSDSNAVKQYIHEHWTVLTRSTSDLAKAAQDDKLSLKSGQTPVVYVSRKEDIKAIKNRLKKQLKQDELMAFRLEYLPTDVTTIKQHGLLYLPEPYVVPGSRFNELYAWDSYFIERGLLADDQIQLAKSLVNNLIYEVEYYGTVLNANRTYYLTRSQPPLFSHMVMALYDKTEDLSVIKKAMPAMLAYHKYWTDGDRNICDLDLSRYYTNGHGPADEVIFSEKDIQGNNTYKNILEYYQKWPIHAYDLKEYYDKSTHQLTSTFYKGDRAVRASGYDISNRYGPFSIDIIHYAPVTLNTLLFITEKDIARAYHLLGLVDEEKVWQKKASVRKKRINEYLWNEDLGLYLPYNYKTKHANPYIYADTFFPLWAGVASPEQAQKVTQYLNILLKPGGLMSSAYFTGLQWDAPFAWAPLQLIAYEGLKRYGYMEEAKQLSQSFVANVNQNFKAYKTLFEKYNALNCGTFTYHHVKFGYATNEIGFGWTNAVYLLLASDMQS